MKKLTQQTFRLFHIGTPKTGDVDEITVEDCTPKKSKVPKGFKTFDDWSKDGFMIHKGSKATWFNGVAYFKREQVSKTQLHPSGFYDECGDWDEWDDCSGIYDRDDFF